MIMFGMKFRRLLGERNTMRSHIGSQPGVVRYDGYGKKVKESFLKMGNLNFSKDL